MKFGASVTLRLAAMFAFGLTAASGTTLFSNIGVDPVSFDTVGNTQWYAQSFTVQPGDDTLLQSVTLLLSTLTNTIGTVQVDLWSSDGNATPSPAAFLVNIGTLDDSNLTSTATAYQFTLSTLFALTESTRYWIVLSDKTGGSTFKWNTVTLGSGTRVAGEFTSTSTGSWFTFNPTSNGTPGMEIGAVPEPSTLVISGLGLAALALRRRLLR